MKDHNEKPQSFCSGVAGAVIDNKAELLNLGWEVDGNALKSVTGINNISLINDLEANAYGLACLKDEDFAIINKGEDHPGNAAIIAPGTGLGEAGLFWDGKFYHPFATEGGHCDFSPRTDLDFELTKYFLKQKEFQAGIELYQDKAFASFIIFFVMKKVTKNHLGSQKNLMKKILQRRSRMLH